MDWGRYALVVAVSGVAASVSDGLFMGALFHKRYLEAQEIWRQGMSERNKIIYSELIGLITCAGFAWLLVGLHHQGLVSGVKTALAIWVVAVIPILFTNSLWVKLSPWIAASHSAGWLARLLITAGVAAWLL